MSKRRSGTGEEICRTLFVHDARQSAERNQLEYAVAQLNVALEYDPDLAEARLLKGQLLIVQKNFTAARKELEAFTKQRPRDKDAAELLKLCQKAQSGDRGAVAPIIEVLVRQKAFGLAA